MLNTNGSVKEGITFPTERFFFSLAFAYACFMALLLQKAILPLFPEMHAGHGLLMNDAIFFHNLAVEIAQRIDTNGWSEWKIYPEGASANVALLSLLYALLGPDPAWFVPFNAAAHATGALLIYRIGTRLVNGDVGKLGGLLAAISFVVFPSALQWYGQNHKDAFAIAGLLLMLDAWLALHDDHFCNASRNTLSIIFRAVLGSMLLGLVRPYFVVVIVLGFLVSFLVVSIWRSKIKFIVSRLAFVVVIALTALIFGSYGSGERLYGGGIERQDVDEEWVWEENDGIPSFLEKTFRRASEIRRHFIVFGRSVDAGSEIDGDHQPNNAWAALAYMPRALFIGLFAPFPDTWTERVTLPRLIGAIETAIWYLAAMGGIISFARYRNRKMLAGVIFCAVIISTLAYIHPNVGTLYRQRFGLWNFFMLLGCIGWASLIVNFLRQHTAPRMLTSLDEGQLELRSTILSSENRLSVNGSGSVVLLITLACYLGFFSRDLLITGHLGLSEGLDAYFSAMMIPMFFVSCLAMPLGEALVSPFISASNETSDAKESVLGGTLSLALILLVGATCFLLVSAPWLVSLTLNSATDETQNLAVNLVRWFAPIITLSAWTVVGNSALNSLGKPHFSALGQLAVPAVTLLALILAPSEKVMIASILGMLLGTCINALYVFWKLYVGGLLLLPRATPIASTWEVRHLYWPLVAAAILPAALIPMNYAFAATVSTGMVGAWAFASKIVVLFSGLASVGATSIALPRIVNLICSGQMHQVQRDANLLIALGVWVGGLLMFGGFLFAEPMVALLLGKGLSVTEVTDLALITKIGLMQIPVIIIGILINKLAIATGRSSRVMYSAMIAFAANFVLNFLLVPKIGVLGVAIGALCGGVISVIILLSVVYRQIGLSLREIFIALLSWFSWVAVCIGLLSGSLAAIVGGIILLVTMARLQWMALDAPNSRLNYLG